MTPSLNKLISRAVEIPGLSNPVAYNKKYKEPCGYWVCRECAITFYLSTEAHHYDQCSTNDPNKRLNNRFIYVLGANDNGIELGCKNIEEVKKIARERMKK